MGDKKEAINYSFRNNISKEEIPSTTYLTHGVYSYPAKFIPHVPYFVIKNFTKGQNNIIIDPFAGSSTTGIESIKSNNNCILMDNNPILDILAKAKTMSIDFTLGMKKKEGLDAFLYNEDQENDDRLLVNPDKIIQRIKKCEDLFYPDWDNLDHWVEPEFKDILARIWGFIHNQTDSMSESLKTLLVITALYVTKRYTNGALDVPKLYKSKLRIKQIEELKQKFKKDNELPYKLLKERLQKYYIDFKKFSDLLEEKDINVRYFNKKTLNSFSFEKLKENERFIISLGDVDSINYQLPTIFKNKIDLLVTSPPYVYAQEYIRSTKLDMYWLNLVNDKKARELAKTEIGHRKSNDIDSILTNLNRFESFKSMMKKLYKVEEEKYRKKGKYTLQVTHYFNDMYLLIKNMKIVLKDKGIFAFFIGNPTVLGEKLPCCQIFMDYFKDLGYKIKEYGYDPIVSRALLRKRKNQSPNGMEYEWLIIAENQL